MPADSTEVRVATLTDTAALGHIHVAAWRAAYGGLMPADYLAAMTVEERAALWTSAISRANPTEVVFVAHRGGPLEGFCAAGNARRSDEAGLGEIYSLNVHPSAWGTGVGDALLIAAQDWMTGEGFRDVVLWVVRENRRARRFYERNGWTCDGSAEVGKVLGVAVPEVRYRQRLTP
jgi:GNAT superfamily N-acetyltransferase